MTFDDEIREGLKWEAKQEAKKRAMRRERIELALMVAVALGFIVFMIWWNLTQPIRERAAYLEGYHGVSHAVAMQMAEKEVR